VSITHKTWLTVWGALRPWA